MSDLLKFARLLREAGLVVAPSEIVDAVRSVHLLNLDNSNPEHFHVLQSCLVKRVEDQPVFYSLYQLFFQKQGGPSKQSADNNTRAQTTAQGMTMMGLSTLAQGMLDGEFAPCMKSLHQSVRQECKSGIPVEEITRRALVSLDYFSAVNSLRLKRQRGELPEWQYQTVLSNAEMFTRQVQTEVLHRLLELGGDWQTVSHQLNWRKKSFNVMNAAELGLVKNYLDKIGRRLAVRYGLKVKESSSGAFDLRFTLRKAMARGGRVWNLTYSRKIPTKPDLILLCDVSNSVYLFTGFMLQLVAAFKERFSRVRAFVFVDTLWEIPQELFQRDIERTLEDVREQNRCSISGLSDFGKVFCQFESKVISEANSATTLLILGDARTNWNPPEVDSFKKICGALRKVYWLNPLPREQWGEEDCQMALYSPYCKGVFECGNLLQLEEIAARIL